MGRRRNRYQGMAIGVAMLGLTLVLACEAKRAPGPGGTIHVVTMGQKGIEPESLTARRGETVVWSNATSYADAVILFENGKGVSQACADPVGFFRPAGGDYTSGLIAPGGEASLCIAAAGTYEYRIEQMRSGRSSSSYRGRIIVQ